MIYIYECPADRLEEVRAWMTAKDTEVFGNLTRKEAKIADGHAGVMEIVINEGDITCECNGIYSGPEREIQYEMENIFRSLKWKVSLPTGSEKLTGTIGGFIHPPTIHGQGFAILIT